MRDIPSDQPLEPTAAASHIRRAERYVRTSRRWHAASALVLGLATIGWFAGLGAPASRQQPLLLALVVMPTVLVALMQGVRSRHRPAGGRALSRVEQRLANAYMLLLLPVGIATDLLPHPLPAMLMGIVPALPCLAGAWLLARR